jgi:ketosteroid isomerase-like protein
MKSKYLISLAVLAVTITAVFSLSAQNLSRAEKDVRKLERARLDAYEKKDVAAMNAIVADDFTITFADGEIQTKPQIIESLKRPGGTTRFTTENVQSRAYGDTVIHTGLVISGPWMSDRSRYTDTYVKRNGKWQVVASHLSKATK